MNRGKGADAKPRGRMTAYAFFVQTCREEHKKKHPEESVIFAEFSRKCAERWKVRELSFYFFVLYVVTYSLSWYVHRKYIYTLCAWIKDQDRSQNEACILCLCTFAVFLKPVFTLSLTNHSIRSPFYFIFF